MSYQVLYLFQHADFALVEVQRLDRPATAPPAQLYYWLRYDFATGQLARLDFVAMSDAPPLQSREFRQGTLRFTKTAGTFQPVGAAQPLALRRAEPPTLPEALADGISRLLATMP